MSVASSPNRGVWAPLLARLLAGGVALLGLAGIGFAASRSPELLLPAAGAPALQFASALSAPLGSSPGGAMAGAAGAPAAPPVAAAECPCPCSAATGPSGEPAPAAPATRAVAASAASAAGAGLGPDGRVILNRATAADLQKLPGIGERRALAILELRTRLGRFRRIEELLRIKGIGPRLLERLAPRLLLDAPAPAPPS